MSKYPKSFIKTVDGNGVEKIAHNEAEETQFTSQGFTPMGAEPKEPAKVPPFTFTQPAKATKPEEKK